MKQRLIFKTVIYFFFILSFHLGFAQQPNFENGQTYTLGGITVKGSQVFSEQRIINYSGLVNGTQIKIPGDKLTSAIKKLYKTKRFDNVEVYVTKLQGNTIYLEFEVKELPQLTAVKFTGVSKSKAKDFQKEINFKKGANLSENLITSTKNYIKDKYKEKGYYKTKVYINTRNDDKNLNKKRAIVRVDKGKLVKVKNIYIYGNDNFSKKKVRKYLKNTKRKFWGRFWKRSKYVEENFTEDKENLIKKYRQKGYRDARVIKDSLAWNPDGKHLDLYLTLEEGNQYRFKSIDFLGNQKYSSEQLSKVLKINPGDIYDSESLSERVLGDGTPDSDDISSLYQNNGYLFSRVNFVETAIENDSIAVEIRIIEDKQATINHVTVSGNDRTNDHVIFRELRVRPGDLYSKDNLIRSLRELGQMGFFDAETIRPDLKPNYVDKTVDVDFVLEEKGSSQVQLQGGYGAGTFIGTLGLSFNNFSIRNLFNKEEYKPLPMGDGQTLGIRYQTSRLNQTASLNFSEPWLGGKKPRSFNFSISNTRQYGFGSQTNAFNTTIDKSQQLNIFSVSVGIGERLKWPDDYFTLSQAISYQRYKVDNFNFGSSLQFENNTGVSNNLSYNVTLSRNSAGPSPIFPRYGSTFTIAAKFTPPYSLLSGEKFDANSTSNQKFDWLEFYKINLKGKWYTKLVDKFVLQSNSEFGYLGHYNSDIGEIPFQRYFVGGDGLNINSFDGRDVVGLRGYPNQSLSQFFSSASDQQPEFLGATVYSKFSMELRYPLTLKPAASIYALGFAEAGNSYQNFKNFNPFDIKRSAGLGLRIFMPAFGLLGVDFGYGFDENPITRTQSGWQTHFIIGQQF